MLKLNGSVICIFTPHNNTSNKNNLSEKLYQQQHELLKHTENSIRPISPIKFAETKGSEVCASTLLYHIDTKRINREVSEELCPQGLLLLKQI